MVAKELGFGSEGAKFYSPSLVTLDEQREAQTFAQQSWRHLSTANATNKPSHTNDATNKAVTHNSNLSRLEHIFSPSPSQARKRRLFIVSRSTYHDPLLPKGRTSGWPLGCCSPRLIQPIGEGDVHRGNLACCQTSAVVHNTIGE
ncbi:hypothetical protein TNCV_2032351 [Trichonephila clavipes]|nr:hypothetical protein TNCV_2032351 [Trichonephila clavipes]